MKLLSSTTTAQGSACSTLAPELGLNNAEERLQYITELTSLT